MQKKASAAEGQTGTLDFNVHYGAWGAYASFVFGRLGKGGGFALSDVQPGNLPVYAGYWQDGGAVRVLPFFEGSGGAGGQEKFNTAFTQGEGQGVPLQVFTPREISRDFGWCRDRYQAGNLALTLHTPLLDVPDLGNLSFDQRRFYSCPSIFLEMELDNSDSPHAMTAFFAMGGVNRTFLEGYRSGLDRPEEMGGRLAGAGHGSKWGFAVRAQEGVREYQAWEFMKSAWNRATGRQGMHRLGAEGGLLITLAPGEKRRLVIAMASWQDGIVTTGIESRFYYTTCFRNLEDVLDHALDKADHYLENTGIRDAELARAPISPDRKFLIAQAGRSYLASTELLVSRAGETLFVVNEGEYRMMNTLDLTVDQVFWELQFSPWTVKNVLDFHLRHSSYRDRHGLSFSHDQGVSNVFAATGTSSYEVSNIKDCFSFMTFEELLNWILTAVTYVRCHDDETWFQARSGIFDEVFSSCLRRDANHDGLMDLDSDRCGTGAEITTYDSLDVSLGQARNNLYMAVKTLAAWEGFALVFDRNGKKAQAHHARELAALAASSITSRFLPEEGYIPAVFEGGNTSRIIPAVEGLVYPWVWGDRKFFDPAGPHARLLEVLRVHLGTVLVPGVCIDGESGGWKLSSTSVNTWMSKIFINQFVVQEVLACKDGQWDEWDAIHAGWLRGPSADFAATDQVDSRNGKDMGSRLYPRLVTSLLWLRYR